MRPRSLSAMPWSLAHARMSVMRARLGDGPPRALLRSCALRACSMWGASCRRKAATFCAQVDLVASAVDREPHHLIRWAAVEIVFQDDGYLRCIVASLPVMGYLHGTDHLPCRDRPHRADRPGSTGSGRFWGAKRRGRIPAIVATDD
jgi:hypothetical protein